MNLVRIAFWALTLGLASSLEAAHAATESVVYSFSGASGAYPVAALIAIKGTLYGTTGRGGVGGCDQGCGTVFSFDPASTAETVLHSFQDSDVDGDYPLAGLTYIKGVLYGTTSEGGETRCYGGGCGTIFSLDLSTDSEVVVHRFVHDGVDGYAPYAGLTNVDGVLYGTTAHGGPNHSDCRRGCGAAYAFDPVTGVESVLHDFHRGGSDGFLPYAGLMEINRKLYGTTHNGVRLRGFTGTVFALDPATGHDTVLHSFGTNAGDGQYPQSALLDVDGNLFGTTTSGGTYDDGTVFLVNPKTGDEEVVYSFQGNGADGADPQAGLIDVTGTLYGTTQGGGVYGYGTVFSVNPKTGAESVLHSFQNNGKDGVYPSSGLINLAGTLYGTTANGGTGPCQEGVSGCGAIFSIKP